MEFRLQEIKEQISAEKHACESHLEGDWIIWTCRNCGDYERRLNWRTGETKSKKSPLHAEHYAMNLTHGISPRLADFLN